MWVRKNFKTWSFSKPNQKHHHKKIFIKNQMCNIKANKTAHGRIRVLHGKIGHPKTWWKFSFNRLCRLVHCQRGSPRRSAKYKTFLLLHITIQCVPGEPDFELFTIIKFLFGMRCGKLSAAVTLRNLNYRFFFFWERSCNWNWLLSIFRLSK